VRWLRGVCQSPSRRAGSHVADCGGRVARPASFPRPGRGHIRWRPSRSGRIVRPHPMFVSKIRMLISQTRCSYASTATPYWCPAQDCARPKHRIHASRPTRQRRRRLRWAPLRPLLRLLRRRWLRPQVGLQVRPHHLHLRFLHVTARQRLLGLVERTLRSVLRK